MDIEGEVMPDEYVRAASGPLLSESEVHPTLWKLIPNVTMLCFGDL
jgi:hypothetical protein